MDTLNSGNLHNPSNNNWIDDVLTLIEIVANANVPIIKFADTMVMLIKIIQIHTPQLASKMSNHMRFTPPRENPLKWLMLLKIHLARYALYQNTNKLQDLGNNWGSIVWKFIHKIASITPSVLDFKNFINTLVQTLPCEKCVNHAKAYVDTHPIIQNTNLFEWSHAFHSHVNQLLSKSDLTLDNARIMYPLLNTDIKTIVTIPLLVETSADVTPIIVPANVAVTNIVQPRKIRVCGNCSINNKY